MAKKRRPRQFVAVKEGAERIPKAYADYLRAIAEAADLSPVEIAEIAGVDRKMPWRVWHYKPNRGKYPSIVSAAQVQGAMMKKLGKEIAPPCVFVTDEKQYEWIAAGERLRAVRPDSFNHVIEIAKSLARRERAADRLTELLIATLEETLGQLATRISAIPDTDLAGEEKIAQPE